MENKKNNHNKAFMLSTLSASILLLSSATYALEMLPDQELRHVNGQDGLAIELTYDQINIDRLYWEDNVKAPTTPIATDGKVLKAAADTVVIKKSNASTDTLGPGQAGARIEFDTGSDAAGKTGIDLNVRVNPLLLTVDEFKICEATTCTAGVGNLAIQTTSDTNFRLKTKDGLFSPTSQSELTIGLKNANIYLGQTDATSQLNQLVFHNTNFNFDAKGVMFVDAAKGLTLQTNTKIVDPNDATKFIDRPAATLSQTPTADYGYVDLNRVQNSAAGKPGFINTGSYQTAGKTTNSGLNLELMIIPSATNGYGLDANNSPTGAQGLIRVGASGRMVNSSLNIRGVDLSTGTDPLGLSTETSKNVMGNSGIALRMKADFTTIGDAMLQGDNNKATTLEIGGAGLNTYGFEFGNLTGLLEDTRGTFDSGDVYINLVDSANIKLGLNTAQYNHLLTSTNGVGAAKLLTAADYTQKIYTGVQKHNSVVMAVRGAEFQAFSRRGRFTTTGGITNAANLFSSPDAGLNNTWGLALPVYNLNANFAMYSLKANANESYYYRLNSNNRIERNSVATSGTTDRLGLSFAMSTDGTDRIAANDPLVAATPSLANKSLGNKTTSILILDGDNDYYLGLRNIDMFMKGLGHLGVEKGSLNLTLPEFLLVMSGEIAGGKLPERSSLFSCVTGKSCSNFSSDYTATGQLSDVLTGLHLRLAGSLGLSLLPQNQIGAYASSGQLGIIGELHMPHNVMGNTVQIVDPFNNSKLGLDNITGRLSFNSAIVIGKAPTGSKGEGLVSFNNELVFNRTKTKEDVFRVRDVQFYAPGQTAGQRLGELAITGGSLKTELSIIPRNGAF